MQFVVDLWVPIVVSGIAAFAISAVAWTVLPFHNAEWSGFSNEDEIADAMRKGSPSPGRYMLPFMSGGKEAGSPEGQAKMQRGPIAYITVAPNGVPQMGGMMAKSLVFNLIVSVFVAYVAVHALAADAPYLAVFQITGAVSFVAYAAATVPESIWFARPWKGWLVSAADALVTALVTGGIFGWLWS